MKALGIAGYSGSGKTTLMERVIPLLAQRGLRVSVVKHAHHALDFDTPGKDSWRHREAGAYQVMVASERRWALLHELRGAPEPQLSELMSRMTPCDLVLVEGFKREPILKLEVHRAANGKPSLYPDDPHVIALCTDAELATVLPTFRLDDYAGVAAFIMATLLPR
jgi:molybdopterin-guanine dinucleotide biosynthesis adapter protein